MWCSLLRSRPICRSDCSTLCAAKRPSSRMQSGFTSRICSCRNGSHAATSSRSGLRLPGGRHFRTLAMNTSASGSMPAASSIASSSLPAWPTNASPRRSSSAPGASPISSQRACCGVPRPNTVCVRVCDSRQRRQSATSSRSWIQRSASVSGRGTSASAIPAGAAADASPLPREPATGDVRGVCLPVAAGGASSQTGICTRRPLSSCQGSVSQLASAWSSSQAGWPVSGSPTALPCASRDDEPDMEPDTGVCCRWVTSWGVFEDPDRGPDTGADAGAVCSGTAPFAGPAPWWSCPPA